MIELNTWGIVGILYVAFWNFMGVLSLAMFRKEKASWAIPIVVALVTIPTFIFGLIGNGN